ncbi:hypothetical protein [Fibrisoma limi]|uniref:hypothetical protein n=1 Tax=Fibrisoma limi TaxID=663275 RepID=UPI0011818804|nr:hypothetical protein [Fibrisoma limi]
MPFLSDAFPEDLRKQYAERNLKIGTILRVPVTDVPGRDFKFYVVVGYSNDKIALGVLYINSVINPNVFPTEELRRLHVPIKLDHRKLVDKDCYIDCSKIYEKEAEHINDLVISNPEYVRGQLDERETGTILSTIYSAKTISRIYKRRFGIE